MREKNRKINYDLHYEDRSGRKVTEIVILVLLQEDQKIRRAEGLKDRKLESKKAKR